MQQRLVTWKIKIMRVAVTQFATSLNVQENLATCIRMIKEAATCEPSLIVLPEFCNTQFFNMPLYNAQPCYLDHNQAWEQALSINGDFIQGISEQAKMHECYILINVTLRQDSSRKLSTNKYTDEIKSKISITSCLFSPHGELIHQVDKQQLTEQEQVFFSYGSKDCTVVAAPIGKLGLLAGSDSMNFASSRKFALNGATLLCHSMSSSTLDQSNLHNPARACENNVFLVSANKVGSLIPVEKIQVQEENTENITQRLTPKEYFIGVGQSQIISPNGEVIANIDNNAEGFIFADIALTETKVGMSHKHRPDGTCLTKQLRPELYQKLTYLVNQSLPIKNNSSLENTHNQDSNVPITANVAIFATYKSNKQAIEDVCHYIENNLSDIIQLPELFFLTDKAILNKVEELTAVANLSKQLISQVSSALRPFQYICTSLIVDGIHQAVIINEHGLYATQQQLHFCQRYQWTELGNDLNIIELPLEQGKINVAMLTADDANIPEIVNIVALNDIHVLLVPFDIQESCEVEHSLLSHAAENRVCIVAASREKSFTNNLITRGSKSNSDNKKKTKTQKSTGLIANLTTDSALLTHWKSQKFNGYINPLLIKHQHGKITKAVIHPIAACHKSITIPKMRSK